MRLNYFAVAWESPFKTRQYSQGRQSVKREIIYSIRGPKNIAEMTLEEVASQLKHTDLIVFAAGATEGHGPHLALETERNPGRCGPTNTFSSFLTTDAVSRYDFSHTFHSYWERSEQH